MLLDSAIDAFLQAKADQGRRPATLDTYRAHLHRLLEYAGPCALATVTAETFVAFRRALEAAGAAPNTVTDHMAVAKTFWRWAGRELGAPPAQIAVPVARPRPLETLAIAEADRDRLIAAEEAETAPRRRRVALRNVACLRLLSETACRVSALCGLRIGDVDLDRQLVTLSEKGGRLHLMPFTARAAGAVRAWLEVRWPVDDWLFTTRMRTPLSPHALRLELRALAAREGVTGRVNPHAFRHAWALAAARRRINFRLIQRGLGHASPITTMRYLEPTLEDLAAAVAELAPE